ncbi:hypothetical protein E2C01_022691 [Portunus trituberculatus]|uniref:Uncharacterized protein n=1 Tax=Portunus trituberculatus TaxID=210409 RepID=A0A5B7E6P5_PORTR|nr:hypothetical protein [Portunus trituberculatus]
MRHSHHSAVCRCLCDGHCAWPSVPSPLSLHRKTANTAPPLHAAAGHCLHNTTSFLHAYVSLWFINMAAAAALQRDKNAGEDDGGKSDIRDSSCRCEMR